MKFNWRADEVFDRMTASGTAEVPDGTTAEQVEQGARQWLAQKGYDSAAIQIRAYEAPDQ